MISYPIQQTFDLHLSRVKSSPTLRTSEDSATQTSVPSTPLLPLKRRGMVDVPANVTSPENGSKNDNTGRSIALGESASMYDGRDVREEDTDDDDASCEDIIAQLKRARSRPLPEEERRQHERRGQRAAVPPNPMKPSARREDDLISGTVARLRHLGVSFISPEDMR